MSPTTDRPTAGDRPGNGLALGLALRRVSHRQPRAALLTGMPFLALQPGAPAPVAGHPLDDGPAGGMTWAGPNMPVAAWPPASSAPAGHPPAAPGNRQRVTAAPVQAAAPAASAGTGMGPGQTSAVPAAGTGAPALGMMLAKSDGAGATTGAGLPTVRTPAPALFGLIGEAARRASKDGVSAAGAVAGHGEPVHATGPIEPWASSAGAERRAAPPSAAAPPRPSLPAPAASGQSSMSIVGRIATALAAKAHPQADVTAGTASPPKDGRQQPRMAASAPDDHPAPAPSAPQPRPVVGTASGAGRALLNLLPALAIRASDGAMPDGAAPDLAAWGHSGAEPGVGRRRKTGMASASPGAAPALPFRSETPSLPAREAAAGVASLDVAISMIGGLVERTVERTVERAIARKTAADRRPVESEPATPRPPAGEIAGDGAVRAMMQRMRDRAQEEHFRAGRLR